MTTPTDIQNATNAVQWSTGRGGITGSALLGIIYLIISMFNSIGTTTGGVYNLTITAQSVIAGLGYAPVPHVANNAALGAINPGAFSGAIVRDGVLTAGDGGRAAYIYSATACSISNGNGGTEVPAGTGCWNIDLGSVGFVVSPQLFESVATATDDTAAITAAVATGQTVHLPYIGRAWLASADIPQTTSGQLIYGDNRISDQIFVNATAGFTKGVFVSTAAEPGPTYRGFSVLFAQADPGPGGGPSQLANIRQYVPAFYSQYVSRTRYEKIGCYLAWTCIDQRGGGGWYIDDMQMSNFSPSGGVLIDAALDTVHITNFHDWVFNETPNMQAFNANVTNGAVRPLGLSIGRCDGCYITNSLFYVGLGINTFYSTWSGNTISEGIGFGTVSNTDFDSYNGAVIGGQGASNANFSFVGDDFTEGQAGAQGLAVSDGIANVSGCWFFGATAGAVPVTVIGTSGLNSEAKISSSHFDSVSLDLTDITVSSQSGGSSIVTLVGDVFTRLPNVTYTNPTIKLTGVNSQISGTANIATQLGSGSGTFISIGTDNVNRWDFNESLGWSNTVGGGAMASSLTPTSSGGIYVGN